MSIRASVDEKERVIRLKDKKNRGRQPLVSMASLFADAEVLRNMDILEYCFLMELSVVMLAQMKSEKLSIY